MAAAGTGRSSSRRRADDEDATEVEEERFGRTQGDVGLLELVLHPVEHPTRSATRPVKPTISCMSAVSASCWSPRATNSLSSSASKSSGPKPVRRRSSLLR